METFFGRLLDTQDFPARWHCGNWSPAHGWLHIASDFLIFGAYTAIPIVIAAFVIGRKDLPFPKVAWLFAAFIFACGFGHLIEASIFWWPTYRLSGLNKAITAAVSWATVFALIPILPKALALPGLAKINTALEKEIEERERFEQELRALNKELDEFTFIVSHDLQEPVRKQRMLTGMLREELGENLSKDGEFAINVISESAERMQILIQDLLIFSRAGRSDAALTRISLRAVVTEALETLSITIADANAEVVMPDLPEVMGDRTLLVQLYQNLIENAIKYAKPGQPPRIEFTCERQSDMLILGVRDHGIGFDPGHAQSIFAPFKKLHSRDEYPGSGIGLAICRKVVERHHGTIWAEAVEGQGAHFKFTLEPTPVEGPTR